jgi:CRISPR-associated endonuclease/helicase Cas3
VSSFEEFFLAATGRVPQDYQRRLAEDGMPESLTVPGAGRTGVVLAWLWRRLHWPADQVPRRLVYVLPQGSLVEPVAAEVARWLTGLGLQEQVALLPSVSSVRQWRRDMHGPAIVIGTPDIVVSKALNRGFGVGAIIQPIDFALVTNGAQWVFDEVSMCPRSAATLRRLVSLAAATGTAEPLAVSFLSSAEPADGLVAARLGAGPGDYPAIAAAAAELHRPGTRTLIVLNSVRAAQRVRAALAGGPVDCVLVHAEFRGRERRAIADRVAGPVGAGGQIVVATPVVEAGLPVFAELVISEGGPGTNLKLRAGRCEPGGRLFWVPGSGTGLGEAGNEPREAFEPQEIFETPAAGATGGDLDVAGLVGDGDDLEAQLIWARWTGGEGGRPPEEFRLPGDDWRCRASLARVAELARRVRVWRLDWARDGWVELTPAEEPARPGELLVVGAADGGYDSEFGFDPGRPGPVADCPALDLDDDGEPTGEWVSLAQHSEETRDQAAALLEVIQPSLSEVAWRSVICAAYLHDVGKAHPTWQDALCAVALDAERERVQAGRPWAKSGTEGRLVFAGDVTFRHELASLLLVGGPLRGLVDAGADVDLVRYLVLAHHGRLRMRVTDPESDDGSVLFGLAHGGTWAMPAVLGQAVAELSVDLTQFSGSWTTTVLSLLERYGPFVLAYLETLVRIADWRSSGRNELPV